MRISTRRVPEFGIPKGLRKLLDDPRVESISNEGEDGYWIYLAAGYICGDLDTTVVHEWTVRDLLLSFGSVREMTPAELDGPLSVGAE